MRDAWSAQDELPVSDLRSYLPPDAANPPLDSVQGRESAVATAAAADMPPLSSVELKLRELSSGPRVDNEPVWQFLDRCEQMEEVARKEEKAQPRESETSDKGTSTVAPVPPPEKPMPLFGLGQDRGRAVRHLGSFLYDPTGQSTIPAELLVNNIGATIEVRISGRTIGLGITEAEWQADEARLQAHVMERIQREAEQGIEPSLALERTPAVMPSADEFRGRWRLGWRGLEHARINREIRLAHAWHEQRCQEKVSKRRRTWTPPRPADTPALPTQRVDDATLAHAAWQFWAQPSLDHRKLWGTDVYTDDSDVLAMCVHAGWIEAPHIPGVPEWLSGGGGRRVAKAWTALAERQAAQTGEPLEALPPGPPTYLVPHSTCDLSVVLRIAPKLILYKGCHRGGVQSRSWGNTHDGVSLVVESVELRSPQYAACNGRRSAKARMTHMQTLRQLAQTVPVPRSIANHADDHAPPLALPAMVHKGARAFWDVRMPAKAT